MPNGKVYKRFCAIMIGLGIILSVGQFSYAHSPELVEAEKKAKEKPTPEILENLCGLYKKDIKYHYEIGEYNEAKKSTAYAASTDAHLTWIRAMQVSKMPHEPKDEVRVLRTAFILWYNSAKLWDVAAKLHEAIGDVDNAKYAKAYAAWARAQKAHMISLHKPSIINLSNEIRHWDKADVALSEAGVHNENDVATVKAYAAWARVEKAKIKTSSAPTPDNLDNVLVCLENAAALSEAAGLNECVQHAKFLIKHAMHKKLTLIENINKTRKNFQPTKWDKLSESAKYSGNTIDLPVNYFRYLSDKAKMKKAEAIYYNKPTNETLENKNHYSLKVCIIEPHLYVQKNKSKNVLRAEQATPMENDNKLLENFKYNDLSPLKKEELMENNNKTAAKWQNAATSWKKVAKWFKVFIYDDEVAKLSKRIGYNDEDIAYAKANSANAKANIAWFSAQKARIIEDRTRNHDNIIKNLGNAARLWDKAAYLFEAAYQKEKATNARVSAAWVMAQQASIIEECDDTIKNCENAERLWNEAAHLCEAAYQKEKAVEARKNAELESVRKANAIAYKNMVYFLISNIDENSIESESTPTLEYSSKRPPLL